jgi:hypothetical protein
VLNVASKALELDGKELVPGVKIAAVQGYTITRNEATGDLSIDKSNQTFLRHDTGKIEQTYRPDGVLKAKGNEVTHNRLLTKDLDNFDYIERKQLTNQHQWGRALLTNKFLYHRLFRLFVEILLTG